MARRQQNPEVARAFERMTAHEKGQLALGGILTSLVVLPYAGVLVGVLVASVVRVVRRRRLGALGAVREGALWRTLAMFGVVGATGWWVLEPVRREARRAVEIAARRPEPVEPEGL